MTSLTVSVTCATWSAYLLWIGVPIIFNFCSVNDCDVLTRVHSFIPATSCVNDLAKQVYHDKHCCWSTPLTCFAAEAAAVGAAVPRVAPTAAAIEQSFDSSWPKLAEAAGAGNGPPALSRPSCRKSWTSLLLQPPPPPLPTTRAAGALWQNMGAIWTTWWFCHTFSGALLSIRRINWYRSLLVTARGPAWTLFITVKGYLTFAGRLPPPATTGHLRLTRRKALRLLILKFP